MTHVFYQSITDHLRRSAGRVWWETRGPRYVLTEDAASDMAAVSKTRRITTRIGLSVEILGTQMIKSMIYQKIVQGTYVRKYSRDVIDLYLEIIAEARRVALADYPAAEFHILLWDEDNADNRAIRELGFGGETSRFI